MERVKYHSELHNHDTIGSILDGFGTPKEMMDRCDELGIYGYATTNHGTEYALYYFAEIEEKYKTKTLYGIEFYECDDHTVQDPDNKYYHLLVIAKNDRGITALHELVTIAEEGKYYKPRIDLEQLKPYANDLIIGSACLASKLNRGTYEDMKKSALEYKEIFGDNFYLELQAHTSDDQKQYNKKLMKLHYDTGIPYIITSDTHYVRKEDAINHSKFININRKNADTTTVGEIYENCYLHSTDEMYEIMFQSGLTEDEITIGLQNTNHITDICNGKVKFGSPEMPEVQIPEGFKDSKEYFLHLIYQGWEKKKLEEQIKKDTRHTREDYIARLEKEINVISEMGFIDYHLIVADYCQYAKSQDIPLVPRGSSCGSLVTYLLDISDINPIKYDLLFERYLNKDRVSLPDIDVDYASDERYKVFEYIKQKYGEPYVAQIMNLSTFQPKVSIADAGKMNGISKADVTALKEFMTGDTIDESIEVNKKNPKFQELLHKHADTIALAKSFEGKVKTVGTTACFTGETLIETPNGQEQIKNIKVGDLVLTHKNRYMPVVETMIREVDEICTVSCLYKTEFVFVQTTLNHPFLVLRDNQFDWIEVKNFQPNDKLVLSHDNKFTLCEFINVEIKTQLKTNVYNLTVLDDSSYVANRLVVHNCGCVISSKPINSYCGMKLGESGEQLLQVDKVVCEKLGMVKMDILGTQVLSDIKKTLSLKGIKFYDFLNNLDLDDPKVFDFIEKGLHEGVFQLSGYNMSTFIQKLKPRSIEDLCVGISAYRPGSMAYVNTIADRKNGLEEVTYDHPILENRLKNSYGIAVYQEQVMQILQDIGGFTLARADLVRRGICKGHAEYVTCQRDAFIYGEVKMNNEFNNDGTNIIRTYEDVKANNIDSNEYTIIADGAINKGIDEQIAIKIFNDLAEFAKYGFNKSHGIAYAIVTYITAYLLLYYPNEYTSVILSSSKDAIDLNKYLLQGLKMGINILNPDINNSELGFRLYNGQILYGIGSLTNLGLPKVEQIIKKRPYTSFEDFMNKNYHNIEEGELKLDKSSLVSLINSGCFDNLPMLETDTEKSTRPVLLLYVFNTITDKISKVTTTTIPEMLENTNLIDTKKYAVELEVYNLHKELKKHKLKLDLTQDDELISKVKLYYPEQVEKKNKKGEVTDVINVYEVNFDLNTFTLTKQYDKEYKKYLNNLSQDLKEHGEEYAQTVNKTRVMNAYKEYVGNDSLSDLEFDATNFYFSESWLDSTSRIYHSEDFCNIQEEPPEVKWYDKKDTHLIAGVVLGKDKKHQEVFLLTHPHTFVICKLGNVYPSVANDIAKGTKLLLNGYKQGGFFRIEYRNLDGKLNNIKAIKILEK